MKPLSLKKRLLILPLLLFLGASFAQAEVKMPAIFGDHMVLQQDGKIPVWGQATPGELVTVSLGAQLAKTMADAQGKWRIDLPPMTPAAGPQTLTVTGKNSLTFTDVLVGEVWLCAGQSNMEYGIGSDVRAGETIPKANDPQLRLFTIPSNASMQPLEDFGSNGHTEPKDLALGKWQVCTPEMVKLAGEWNGFSAIGYYFGRDIRQFTRRPVGLIVSTRGGTKIDPWISLSGLEKAPAFSDYVKDYEKKSAVANGGASLGPGVPNLPGSIYNATIAPLIPYAIRGVIWYQGESNTPRAAEYATLFPRLISDWREKWGQGNFPFLYVQLAGFNGSPVEDYARLRESQLKTLTVPNTGMASAVDLGNAGNVHPNDKIDVGTRLALVARHVAYGDKAVVFSCPIFLSAKAEAFGKTRLFFQNVGGGLVIGAPPANYTQGKPLPAGELVGFMVAGADRKWQPAKAGISGNSVLVWSEQVPKPIAVRHAWENAPVANLYNKEGLPASPFRTDDWPRSAEPEKNPVPQSVAWSQQCAERVAAIKGKPCDIIFIGDSITQNFVEFPKNGWNLVGGAVWEKYYAKANALDFGVGSDTTRNVLWRLENMDVKDLRPKVAVLLIGTNNTADIPADIAGGVKAVIAKTQQTFPGVKIILIPILPTTRETQRMAEADTIIRTFADERSVFLFDLGAKMPPVGDNWKGIGGDHLHLTPEGYELWASEMAPLLKKLLPLGPASLH